MWWRRLGPPLLLVSCCMVVREGVVHAAEPSSAADVEEARKLYNQGIDLRAANNFPEALKRFRSAYALTPTPVIGLDLAKEQLRAGDLAAALASAQAIGRLMVNPAETAKSTAARVDAAKLAQDLDKRVPKLKVVVKAGDGSAPTLTLGAATLSAAELQQPLRLNAGSHVLVARLEGKPEQKRSFDLKEGDAREVVFDFTSNDKPTDTKDAKDTKDTKDTKPAVEGKTSPLVWVGVGLGGAGLVAGSVTGLLALSKAGTVKDACRPDGACPPDQADNIDASKRFGTISTISFAVAGAGAALAVVGFVISDKSAPQQGRATFTPWVGLGSLGVTGSF